MSTSKKHYKALNLIRCDGDVIELGQVVALTEEQVAKIGTAALVEAKPEEIPPEDGTQEKPGNENQEPSTAAPAAKAPAKKKAAARKKAPAKKKAAAKKPATGSAQS